MTNQTFDDPTRLRAVVEELIRKGRYEFTNHARQTHKEIPPEAKVEAILHGRDDQPNRQGPADKPSYVCWYPHPRHGLLRGVYAIVDPPTGGQVVIITVFPE